MTRYGSNSYSTDILIIGAGPAGLTAALALRKRLALSGIRKKIMVIDKSGAPGTQILSGCLMQKNFIAQLAPFIKKTPRYDDFIRSLQPVKRDELFFLTKKRKVALPTAALPLNLRHTRDVIVSVGDFCRWLSEECEAAGIDILFGTPA